jgi:hypothetical protein
VAKAKKQPFNVSDFLSKMRVEWSRASDGRLVLPPQFECSIVNRSSGDIKGPRCGFGRLAGTDSPSATGSSRNGTAGRVRRPCRPPRRRH